MAREASMLRDPLLLIADIIVDDGVQMHEM